MRKLMVVMMIFVLVIATTACGSKQADAGIPKDVQNQVDKILDEITGGGVGGWTITEGGAVTEEDQAVFDQAVEGENGSYKLVALEATQIVAGLNYCFLCEVTTDGQTRYQILYVYKDLDGNTEITDQVDLAQ